jgi:glycosyltransferase involved in cell wall biosynthesis
MRIAYLSVSDQLGGSEIVLLEMLKGVRRLRPEWTLQLILPGSGPLLDRAEGLGADCVMVPMPGALARLGESGSSRLSLAARLVPVAFTLPGYVRRVRRVLKGSRPAILHTNGFKAHVVGARAAEESKVVWHMHEYVGPRRATRSLLLRNQARVAAIVANSKSVAQDVTDTLQPSVPVHIVQNAVDLEAFSPTGPVENLDRRAGMSPPPGPVVRVGLVATFARWKGHEVFLKALAALPADLPVRGYIIGAPLYDTDSSQYSLEELRALADRLSLGNRVGFAGFLPPAAAMRALDIVVHASTQPEPFGLVIAEALACGRAVITSGAGGAAEVVHAGHDALVHAPGDHAALAECIVRLAQDQELRQTLGVRARASAFARFDSSRLARDLVAVYEATNG